MSYAEPKPSIKEDQPKKMATNKIFIIFYSTQVFSRSRARLISEATEELVTAFT